MQWYEKLVDRMDDKKTYRHKELTDELRKLKNDLSESTYHWAISRMVRDGLLTRQGYDTYSLSLKQSKEEYEPAYSDKAESLIRLVSEKSSEIITHEFRNNYSIENIMKYLIIYLY